MIHTWQREGKCRWTTLRNHLSSECPTTYRFARAELCNAHLGILGAINKTGNCCRRCQVSKTA